MPVEKSEAGECLRCGSCCDKGGPAFHVQDRHLIDNKVIASKHVYTIRKGEPASDNVAGKLIFVKSDIIKLKGSQGTWRCIFLDNETKLCGIYENRPFECRTLKCGDTEEIERAYSKNYLTRKDLFATAEGLYELIEYHQEQCSYEKIRALLKDGKDSSLKEISELIELDAGIRCSLIDKMEQGFDLSELLFGRPLMTTIRGFGLAVVKDGDGYRLAPRESSK